MSTAAVIDIRVLGPLEVRRSGRLIAIPGAKPRALLTTLGLHAGSVLTEDALKAVLWGDDPPPTAHKALQTHISTLRRALGHVVVTRGAGWLLAVDGTDATGFNAAVQAAREASRRGDSTSAADHFGEALSYWRGPPELPPTPRGRAEVTRWVEAHESAVDDRVDARLACGQAAELVGDLESAVADTPLRERRWAQLCLAMFRAGRQGDALQAYQRARSVLTDELGVEPGPELRRLEAAMLAHDASLGVPTAAPVPPRGGVPAGVSSVPSLAGPSLAPESTLPAPRTTFVGRRDELARLVRLIGEHRLITVAGPGGVGKTRLALAAAQAVQPDFPAGVLFVDLAPVLSEFVVETVAAVAGIVERRDAPLDRAVFDHFGAARRLLILDNCEHVVDAAGSFAERLITACPVLVVVMTSRERLSVGGEQVFTVPSLPIGADPSRSSDAEALFLDRARAVDPEFDANPALVTEVCERCDGLPLAIELAAARCASLGIDGLLTGLDDRLRMLVGARFTTQRHRSLRAVLDWSHDLLDTEEQAVFRRIGIFAGSFDLPAAAAVAGAEPETGGTLSALVDVVGRLTDKNLIMHQRSPTGSRWRLLDVVRSYARERLAASGEAPHIQSRYLKWASATAADLEHQVNTGGPWREEFDAITGDLRAALAVQGDPGDRLTLTLALARLHARGGAFSVAQGAYEDAMSMARATSDADQLARAALGASLSGMLFGVSHSRRIELLEEALAAQGDSRTAIRVRLMSRLATELYWSSGRCRGLRLAQDAAALAEELRDDGARAHAAHALHYLTRGPGAWRQQVTLAEQITSFAQRAGETQLELAGLAAHAVGLLQAGDLTGMDHDIDALTEAANRRDHPEFQWYAAVYRLVRALLAGKFMDADKLAATAVSAAQHAPEFAIGLFFAEAITDLRPQDRQQHARRASRLAEMADRFPRVLVWRCLALHNDLQHGPLGDHRRVRVREQALTLRDEFLSQDPRDDHWVVACCLLAEVADALRDAELAEPLAPALQPYAGTLAVAGRVAACRGSVSYALGLLALALGDHAGATRHLHQAATVHAHLGAWPFHSRSVAALERAHGGRAPAN